MVAESDTDAFADVDRIQGFVESGNYHAAINIALSGLNECRRNHDQAGIDEFLDIIKDITQKLAREFGSKDYLNQK